MKEICFRSFICEDIADMHHAKIATRTKQANIFFMRFESYTGRKSPVHNDDIEPTGHGYSLMKQVLRNKLGIQLKQYKWFGGAA